MTNSKPINIRITPSLNAKIQFATGKSGFPQADIMRTALALGMKYLELMDFDIDGAIFDRAQKAKEAESNHLKSLPDATPDTKRKTK